MKILKTVTIIAQNGERYKLKKDGIIPIELTDVEIKALQKAGYISIPKPPEKPKSIAKSKKQKKPKKELIFDTVTTEQHKIEEEGSTKFNFFGEEDE